MYEYGVILKSGEGIIIFGYSYTDALKKWNVNPEDVDYVSYHVYID